MKVSRTTILLAGLIAIVTVVYAGESFKMKCTAAGCGYTSQVTFGGGMAFEQLMGYCRKCNTFVHLSWTREGSPLVGPNDKIIPPPNPLGKVWDAKTGRTLTIYACPHCSGPFVHIRNPDELKHCPACSKPGFIMDDTEPMIAID